MEEELNLDVCELMRDEKDIDAASAFAAHLSILRRYRHRVRATRREKLPPYRGPAWGRQKKPRDFAFGMFCILRKISWCEWRPPCVLRGRS